MKIDKARFLAMTGVLAAASGLTAVSACTLTTIKGDSPDGSTTIPEVDSSATNPDATIGTDSGTDGSTSDAANADASDGSSCLGDDKMLNPACSSYPTTSCAGSPTGAAVCPQIQAKFLNGVSRQILSCLALAPSCEAVPDPFQRCTLEALDKACPDSTTAAACTTAAQTCTGLGVTPTISQAKCQQYLSGLSATGRTQFASCAVEGCTLTADAFCFVR